MNCFESSDDREVDCLSQETSTREAKSHEHPHDCQRSLEIASLQKVGVRSCSVTKCLLLFKTNTQCHVCKSSLNLVLPSVQSFQRLLRRLRLPLKQQPHRRLEHEDEQKPSSNGPSPLSSKHNLERMCSEIRDEHPHDYESNRLYGEHKQDDSTLNRSSRPHRRDLRCLSISCSEEKSHGKSVDHLPT